MMVWAVSAALALTLYARPCDERRYVGTLPADGVVAPADVQPAVVFSGDCRSAAYDVLLLDGDGEVVSTIGASENPATFHWFTETALVPGSAYALEVAYASATDEPSQGGRFGVGDEPTSEPTGRPSLDEVRATSFDNHGIVTLALTVAPDPGFEGVQIFVDGVPTVTAIGDSELATTIGVSPGEEPCFTAVQYLANGEALPASDEVCVQVPKYKGCSSAPGGSTLAWLGASLMLVRRRR